MNDSSIEPLESFGEYISRVREECGFNSQRQLAIASGISNGSLARIESGIQKPTPDTLKILSRHLDVSYEKLLEKAGYLESEIAASTEPNSLTNLAIISFYCRLFDRVAEIIAGLQDPGSTKDDAINELLELASVIHEAISERTI